jgi:hypothetical protein
MAEQPNKKYTEADFAPFIKKQGISSDMPLPLPNAEEVDALFFLNSLAAHGHMMTPMWGYTLLPNESRQQWTMVFLLNDANMGFELGGGGYAVTYGSPATVRRFRICRHEIELAPGANPSRGWNPGKCKHCGMDMTIDSGD